MKSALTNENKIRSGMEAALDVEQCRDAVCSACPGTVWGKKSICRVHNLSIGQIDSCPEWLSHSVRTQVASQAADKEQDLEPIMQYVQQVDTELRDFSWTVREIRRLEEVLEKAAMEIGPLNIRLVAQYGIEAALPKGKGAKVGELSLSEMQYERTAKRLVELKQRVEAFTQATDKIMEERERTVLDCLMTGERMNDIARHIGVSRQRLHEIRQTVIRKLTLDIYRQYLELEDGERE